jgi:hypothetical protein
LQLLEQPLVGGIEAEPLLATADQRLVLGHAPSIFTGTLLKTDYSRSEESNFTEADMSRCPSKRAALKFTAILLVMMRRGRFSGDVRSRRFPPQT